MSSSTAQQKLIIIVATVIFGSLAFCYAILRFCCFKAKHLIVQHPEEHDKLSLIKASSPKTPKTQELFVQNTDVESCNFPVALSDSLDDLEHLNMDHEQPIFDDDDVHVVPRDHGNSF